MWVSHQSCFLVSGVERAEARGGFSICVDGLKILGVRFLEETALRRIGGKVECSEGEDSKVEF